MTENLKTKINARTENTDVSFWFVRHGESEGNVLGDTCPIMHDTPLTSRGRKEAEDVASYLQKEKVPVSHIFTAPKGRSFETAQIIASAVGLPVVVKGGLNERNWGSWASLRWEEASERLEAMTLDERYTFVPPEGESWKEMESRLFSTLEEIAVESVDGENVLIVTHRGCLRAILPVLAKATREKHKEFSVPTGALSKFSFRKDEFDFVGTLPTANVSNPQ